MCRTWFCIWEFMWFYLPKGVLVSKLAYFWPKRFSFRNVSRKKKIMIVYKMHHQDCFSQQEAAGCINDAISIKVNPMESVKRTCRLCFPNWSFPIPRGSLGCFAVASGWWGLYGGTISQGGGKGTGTGKTESFPLLFSIVHFLLFYMLGLQKKSLKECIPGLKKFA